MTKNATEQKKTRTQYSQSYKDDALKWSPKAEAIHGEKFETRAQMRETVFEYIEVDYNRHRMHSYLNYQSLEEFEQQKLA